MSEVSSAPDQGAATPPVAPAELPEQMTESEMSRHLAEKWYNQRQAAEAPTKAAEPPKEIQAQEADAAPQTEDPGEKTEVVEPEAELPPIEPPRSWTKEEKEEFASYPREAQEKIARREQNREAALRRSQNEAAEKSKSYDTKLAQAEQTRQQYEAALPLLLQTLQETQQGEFADIKTMADVEKLAREDWPRYALWDAQQKKIAAIQQEVTAAKSRQDAQHEAKWAEFASKEDQLLLDRAPELADKATQQRIADSAVALLEDVGFSKEDLAKAWNGKEGVSLRDHRLQLLILDAIKYREAKTNVAKPAPKAVPPVQRPGTHQPAVNTADKEIETLTRRVAQTGSLKDATALRLAKMRRAAQG